MLTIAFSPSLSLSLLCSVCFISPHLFYTSTPLPLCSFHRFLYLSSFQSSSFAPLLNAPSGGFGYTGMQSTSQSQFSYSLSQGSRARTQSSDVNEALYNLDRVLQGKSVAYKHEGVCLLGVACYAPLNNHLYSCLCACLIPHHPL